MAERLRKLTDSQCDRLAKAAGVVLPQGHDTVTISSDVLRRLMNVAFQAGRNADVMGTKFK